MLTGAEERASVALLESATKLHRQAIESNDPADWDVAADAYEEYGAEGEAGLCRALAAACRSGVAIYPKPEPTIGPACKRGGEIVDYTIGLCSCGHCPTPRPDWAAEVRGTEERKSNGSED